MCVNPYIATKKDGTKVCVPCGKCLDCRKDFQKEWIFRLSQECKKTVVPVFLTLTYNDENLPLGETVDGEIVSVLVKSDLQKFFKRFRKNGGELVKDCRYFAIGEYGSKFNRCHYHAVLVCPHADRVSKIRKVVEESWTLGFTKVKFCSEKQMHYVCKYMNKLDERHHLVKPFRLMSRGIGLNFLTDDMVRYYLTTFDRTCISGKCRIGLPRYYKRKLDDASLNHPFLSKCGVTYSDLLEDVRVVEGTKWFYFKQFAENFGDIQAECRKRIKRLSRQLGYQYFEPTDQEVWQSYMQSHKYLKELVMESDRILKSCQIRNGLLDMEPIRFGDEINNMILLEE